MPETTAHNPTEEAVGQPQRLSTEHQAVYFVIEEEPTRLIDLVDECTTAVGLTYYEAVEALRREAIGMGRPIPDESPSRILIQPGFAATLRDRVLEKADDYC